MNAYSIIRTFGVVILLAVGIVQCSKIHKRMSDDGTTNLFRTTRDKMMEFDMAPVRHERSDGNLQRKLTTYGKIINGYLNPSDGRLIGENTPVWLASTMPNGTVEYRKMREGIVGIAVADFWANHRDVSTSTADPIENLNFGEARPKRNSEGLERRIRQSVAALPADELLFTEVVYTSLLIQTYYTGAKTKRDELSYTEEIIYQLAFWNAVDLQLRASGKTNIRIHISGIIIGLDPNTTPYLRSDAADLKKIADEAEKYWYTMSQREDFPAEAYHIAVTITDTDLPNDSEFNVGAIATQATCSRSGNNRFHSVAIVRDRGGFDGIVRGTLAISYYVGADFMWIKGVECLGSNGYIMDCQKNIGPKISRYFRKNDVGIAIHMSAPFVGWADMSCFKHPFEFHPSGNPVKKVLPGDLLGPDEQCQARGYSENCDSSPDMCIDMQCYSTASGCITTGPPAEGTVCAPGHKCIEGLCQCMAENCLYIN